MTIVKGIPVSSGVVIGRAFVLEDDIAHRVPRRVITPDMVEEELRRFEEARQLSIGDLNDVHRAATEEMGPDAANIFLFHMGALADKTILGPIHAKIRDELVSAEYAVSEVFGRQARRFARHPEPTVRTKVDDIADFSDRLLDQLIGQRKSDLDHLEAGAVIVARDLTPSQTAAFDRDKVLAFVTDLGGRTSHTAIVARALGLPAVVGCRRVLEAATHGGTIIVDGDRGTVVVDPTPEVIEEYAGYREEAKEFDLSLADLTDLPAVTRDGVEITLLGNIEFPAEVDEVLARGGAGVGLYRTEFLYLTSRTEPSENDHFTAYKACIDKLAGRPLVIRTVDLGADKYTQQRAEIPERNPFLGLRSIRYCLQNLPMFKTQLRAILRASAFGPVKVMFPLVTTLSEFHKGRFLLKDAMEDLADLHIDYDPNIEVGMMVEVPSAAVMADSFAREVDFFSIGTNDLVQYTLAVDRTNERVAGLYNPAHPAVTKLIRDTARAAKRHDIPVSCCGESAGELDFAPLLIGLGLRTLSVTASSIPPLKRMIRSLTAAQCERIAKKAISFGSDVEAAAYIRDRARKLVPEAFDGRSDEVRS